MSGIVCDLVLLSWNHLELTKPCLESLFRSTKLVPSRLIIVDNGSEPPVREFLRSVRLAGAIREVLLIQNEKNEGFPGGMNKGIQASTAPYVCLLNNDLLFTTRWLTKLVEVAEAHPDVGVLNPASSTFGDMPPRGMSLDDYADSLEAKRGLYVEVGMCIGFCMLIKREVIDKIGILTTEVERIFFEDEDYCMRAQAAGYRCVIVQGAYVYHAEHRTVRKMPEREALFTRNQAWCHGKWGRWLRVAYPRFTQVTPGTPELREWLEQLIVWARRRTHVYVYCPANGHTKEALFRSVGLIPHADVHWRPVPAAIPRLGAMLAILKRRKKAFDAILAPDQDWQGRMARLRWLHRAQVVPLWERDNVETIWQTRSPSPSSS